MKNTFLDFELDDGSKIQLTLNFTRLLQLKNKRKDIYGKYTNALAGKGDVFENTLITLYVAYLCANIESLDNDGKLMTYASFINAIPQDFILINDYNEKLLNPKKKTVSENHSLRIQEG